MAGPFHVSFTRIQRGRNIKKNFVMPTVIVLMFIAGCQTGKPSPFDVQLDPAPAHFGAGSMNSVSDFLPGMWALVSQASVEKAATKSSIVDGADHSKVWEFKKDGALALHVKLLEGDVTGTWKLDGDHVTCTYDLFNGLTLAKAREKFQKGAESGRTGNIRGELVSDWLFNELPNMTMLKLADDKITMEFADPNAAPAAPSNPSRTSGPTGAPGSGAASLDKMMGSINELSKKINPRLMRLK